MLIMLYTTFWQEDRSANSAAGCPTCPLFVYLYEDVWKQTLMEDYDDRVVALD